MIERRHVLKNETTATHLLAGLVAFVIIIS